jgi:hypothetical protein
MSAAIPRLGIPRLQPEGAPLIAAIRDLSAFVDELSREKLCWISTTMSGGGGNEGQERNDPDSKPQECPG